MTSLDTRFAAAVRENLISTATGSSALAVRTRRVRIGIGAAAGLAAVSLLTAGALVVAGLVPGEHVITDLSAAVTASGSGTQTVELGARPDGANAVSLVLTCTGAGTFAINTSATETTSMECAAVDELTIVPDDEMIERMLAPLGNTMTISDMRLAADVTSISVTASEGATWSLVAHYVSTVTTDWGVNANGQTYGTPNEKGEPDLIAAQATNGQVGYILFTELNSFVGEGTIPVYESDGVTVIGDFPIGNS